MPETERPVAVELPAGREQATSGLPLTLEAWPAPRQGTRARVLTDGIIDGQPFEPDPGVSEPYTFAFSLPEPPRVLGAIVVWKTSEPLTVEVQTYLGATPIVARNFDEIRNASVPQGSVELPEGTGPFVLELAEANYAHHFWISVTGVTVVHGVTELSALTPAGLESIKDSSIAVLALTYSP